MTYAKSIEVVDDNTFKVVRTTEDGYEEWEIQRPCALTVVKEAGELRLANLRLKMKAKKAEIPMWGVAELNPDPALIGLQGSPTRVTKVFAPPVKSNRETLQGEAPEQVKQLIDRLAERHLI